MTQRNLLIFNDGGTDEDGLLHMYELYGLDINAKLVVLSAWFSGNGCKLWNVSKLLGYSIGFLNLLSWSSRIPIACRFAYTLTQRKYLEFLDLCLFQVL